MSREEFIKKLRESAERLAKVMGCNHFETDKGTCGIWDEISKNVTMTEMLEAQYGDCSTEWVFTNDDKTVRVQTRFRFSHPCISVKRVAEVPYGDEGNRYREDLIELEFGNVTFLRKTIDDKAYTDKILVDFECSQIMLWHDWSSLRDQLMEALDDDIKKIVAL